VYIKESSRYGDLSTQNNSVMEIDEREVLLDTLAFLPGGTPGVLEKASNDGIVENNW